MSNNSSVSHDVRYDTSFSDKLMTSQHDHSRAFTGNESQFSVALLNFIYHVQGRRNPKEEYQLEESPDMPIEYMGSNPASLQFLQTLVLLKQPKCLVEVGTFVGMSGIFMAECLPPGGKLYSFERYDTFAAIARRNITRNKLDGRAEVVCGDAKDTMPAALAKIGPVDMAFIDGDKGAYVEYFRMLDPHMPPGGLLVFDDMVFHGDALNQTATTDKGAGVKAMADLAATADNYHRTLLPVANGTLLMVKLSDPVG